MGISTGYFSSERYLIRGLNSICARKEGVKELLKGVCKNNILDLGCGDGSLSLQFLSEAGRISLVDASDFMIMKCETNVSSEFANKVSYSVSEIERFGTEDRFDVVICVGVLAHVRNVGKVLGTASKYVKKEGFCIFQITDFSTFGGKYIWLYSVLRELVVQRYGYFLNLLTRASLIKMAKSYDMVLCGEYKFTEKTRFFGDVGSEVLLKFKKA